MKSDVKAVRVTGTGTVFAGRTRLRGLILASDGGGAGTAIDGWSYRYLQSGNNDGDIRGAKNN